MALRTDGGAEGHPHSGEGGEVELERHQPHQRRGLQAPHQLLAAVVSRQRTERGEGRDVGGALIPYLAGPE